MQEMIDLVDRDGSVIRSESKENIIAQKIRNFKLVCAFVERVDGTIVIPQRSFSKKVFPGALGLIGGYVQTGETFLDAALRETHEELGFQPERDNVRLLGYANPWDDGTHGFVAVYSVRTTLTHFSLSEEFEQLFFLSAKQLKKKIDVGVAVTNNLPILFKRFYAI